MLNSETKILLADDSRLIRMAMGKMLRELGYSNIVEAEDGAQAVAKHAEEKPGFIFMDIVMPNLNGDEALAQIRAVDKDTPVVMLSSVAKQSEIDTCESLGIVEFVIKPLTAETGPATLRRLLGAA
jgi:CheY-like chemotaxis protein